MVHEALAKHASVASKRLTTGGAVRAPHSGAVKRYSGGPVDLATASTAWYEIRAWQTAKRSVHVVAFLTGTETSLSV